MISTMIPRTFNDILKTCWLTLLIGGILLFCGTGILIWNESNAVRITISLNEALNTAITVNPENKFQNVYDGKLIHLKGQLLCAEPLTEPDYGIQVMAVKLKRRVQMYQWVEETVEHRYGESVSSVHSEERTYYYTMDWKDKLIESRSFYSSASHSNPKSFPIESRIQVSEHVYIGPYELGTEIKDKMTNFIEITSDSRPYDSDVKLHSGLYYHCNDVWNPEIGDIRIQFSFAGLEGDAYSIVGKLKNGVIIPYETNVNSNILLVHRGSLNLNEILKKEHHTKRITTWGFRFCGWIILFFSTTCFTPLVNYLFLKTRYLSNLAPDLKYPVSCNLIISFSYAFLMTSFAWIFHRPYLATGLLVAAFSPFIYCARGVIHQYHRID